MVRYYALRILLPLLVLGGVTFGVGELILAVPTGEDAVSRSLAAGRTPLLNTLTDLGSSLSDTPYIVALTVIAGIVFRLVYHRRLETIFLVTAVWSQSLVFLATTEPVGRHRPPVPHLDPAPPTSSFPSGHVSAAVCFYCGVALVLTSHLRSRALQVQVWVPGVAAPLIVAFSRLYRGMHFLTDVGWGLLLGACCLAITATILYGRPQNPPERRNRDGLPSGSTTMR